MSSFSIFWFDVQVFYLALLMVRSLLVHSCFFLSSMPIRYTRLVEARDDCGIRSVDGRVIIENSERGECGAKKV